MLDDHELGGVQVTAQSRAALMQKLSRGQEYLGMGGPPGMPIGMGMLPTYQPPPAAHVAPPAPSLANMTGLPPHQPMPSDCMLLVNMFDPTAETEPNWHVEIQDDVSDECSKFGVVQKCVVDRNSPNGLVYLKFNNPDSSFKAAQALNGRFFAGKAISALYLSHVIFDKFCPVNT